MDKWIEKFFDLKEVPSKLILVLLFASSVLLFAPDHWISRLNMSEFKITFGKFIGITFIICAGFTVITIVSLLARLIRSLQDSNRMNRIIAESVSELDIHEKALLREFYINGKSTIQLPMDNDTVAGLESKGVIFKVSQNGFTYIDGAFFIYTISKKAKKHLTSERLSLPINPNEKERKWIIENRPQWAKTKSRLEDLARS